MLGWLGSTGWLEPLGLYWEAEIGRGRVVSSVYVRFLIGLSLFLVSWATATSLYLLHPSHYSQDDEVSSTQTKWCFNPMFVTYCCVRN